MIQDTRVDVDRMEAVFSVGDKFKSFDELQAKVHRYEELEFVHMEKWPIHRRSSCFLFSN